MRLIDANKAIDILCKNCGVVPEKSIEKCRIESSDGWCKEYYDLKNSPTVEAIPIEWIVNYVNSYADKQKEITEDVAYIEVLGVIESMIADWRIENYGKTD